jgi:hypothetical protein
MAKHARLSASGSKQWINCPGSVRREEDIPQGPSSIFAMQGTAAHALSDYLLTTGGTAEDHVGERVYVHDELPTQFMPKKIPEGGKRELRLVAEGYTRFVVVDGEGNGDQDEVKCWAVNMFVDFVRGEFEKSSDLGSTLTTEKYMDMSWLHPLMGGTADSNYPGMDGYIKLYDLKFGAGVIVEVKGNTQLKIYAVGILRDWPDALGVDMWIVQPRAEHRDGPIRHVRYSREELLAFQAELKERADVTQKHNAPFNAGDWCLWCKVPKHTCEAFMAMTQEKARVEFGGPVGQIVAPTDTEELARLAEWIPMLDLLAKSVDGAIARELQQGRKVRGWKLVHGKTNRKYGDPKTGEEIPQDEIVRLMKTEGMLSDAEIYKPREILTLAQMEKLGKDAKTAIKKVTYKPEGPLTVAPEGDTREAVEVKVAEFPDDAMEIPGA